ncbi:MAG: glycosyltransferase [Patescibacteria group bacterium]
MKICYFGIYDPLYCRNQNLLSGLRQNGVEIIEVNDNTPSLIKYWRLIKKHWAVRNQYDLLLVGFCGQIVMPLAKLLSRRKIVFDAYISLHDAKIFQQSPRPNFFKAGYYYFLDWLSCRLADVILLDTKEHVEYFAKTFQLKPQKFLVVYGGVDDRIFSPCLSPAEKKKFIVEFHAYATLLHGLKYILLAMKELQDKGESVELWCVGAGLEYDRQKQFAQIELKLDNVKFMSPLPPERLRQEVICGADAGLGIFGETDKVDRVIPNKLYELMACKIPVVSADTPAVREQFADHKHLLLCPKADPRVLAQAILELKNNSQLRKSLAENAYQKIKTDLNPKVIAQKLLADLAKLKTI